MSLRRLIHLLTLALLALAAALGGDAYLEYRGMQSPAGVRLATEGRPAARPGAKKGGADYDVILKRNLFAALPLRSAPKKNRRPARKKAKPAAARPKPSAPSLRLKVRLVGTTVIPGGRGFAILEDPASRQHTLYREGDRVQGAVIEHIRRGEVVLKVNGRRHILRTFEESRQGKPQARGALRGVRGAGGRVPPPGRLASLSPPSPPGSARAAFGERLPGKRTLVQNQLEALLRAPRALDRELRSVAFRGRAGVTGLRLFPIRRNGLMHRMGLLSGDVIMRMNGSPIQTADDFERALGQLLGSGGGEMEILRGGRKVTLSLAVQ